MRCAAGEWHHAGMLSVKSYGREYIDAARSRVDAQVSAYRSLAAATTVPEVFETACFGNLAVVLEHTFVHRMSGQEGKDGNPLNEVRMLAASITANGGRLTPADKQIKYHPEKTILGYAVDDVVAVHADEFTRLADAFFADIEAQFL
jgi:hypothetical protein